MQDRGAENVGAAVDDLGPARVAELDASDMLGAIAGLAGQVRDGYAEARRQLDLVAFEDGAATAAPAPPARPSGVAVLGMGGSAIGADLVFATFADLAVPAVVVRDERLPGWVDERTLVVAVSYSGDTAETLAATAAATARGCRPVCVTAGGQLAAFAGACGLPLLTIPTGRQPRAALGLLAMAVLAALERAGLVPTCGEAVAEAAALLDVAAAQYAPDVGEQSNPAKALARRLQGRVPLVCGQGLTAPVARRWKTQLNENAKVAAFFATLPELDHNEVEAWGAGGPLDASGCVVMLEDQGAGDRPRRRSTVTAETFAAAGVPVERLETQGVSPLARVFSLVALGDHVSLYLALLRGVDPTPVEAIQRLKRRLGDGTGGP
ncbi:MAG TPA: bifunctional phosphoglucose/phosphomannose isomerase [Thermoleophilia bacterium]|nr:bifunctional phosphoglucose/phosphomannose isomerase [Thermoleophilia bacterium]HQG03077.1 bifunctional phosphoglucose/phosphomannose isomerase [Thermoleophilia bacterium]HQG54712.1 bifunctional phosphoglucose/phosphomannose isomerase [Thermoleophilia bacterium]HQJ97490.1 bifunctional phosphoglucose/phosphomannose isomerase [Thermoleophilia bacterium]